jgi:hypothetical protein
LTGKKAVVEKAKPKAEKRVISKEDNIYTPKLTEKQRRFAELVAHGVKKEDAYISVYAASENTKAQTINNNARKLLANVEVLKEIDRLKEVIEITQTIDQIPDEKRLELLTGDTTIEEASESEWNAKVAFKKLSALLRGCEESLTILKERPQLFAKVDQLINEVRFNINQDDIDNEELFNKMDAIHSLVYKLGAFDAKEYNSTISTANSIMKSLNDITGVTKNAKQIENESFERRLLTMISNMDVVNSKSKPDYIPLKKQMEDFAFDE